MGTRFLSPIHKASREIALKLEARCGEMDLSSTESQLLSYLISYSPSTVSDLHHRFGVKRSTLTSILDRLSSRGWVERDTSPRDRRLVLVRLTEVGRSQADLAQRTVEALEADIANTLDPQDLKGFYAVLSAISAAATTFDDQTDV